MPKKYKAASIVLQTHDIPHYKFQKSDIRYQISSEPSLLHSSTFLLCITSTIMIHFVTIFASFSCIDATFQDLLDKHLYAEDFNSKKASNTLIGLATMHIFSFAECVVPVLSQKGRSECFNKRLQSGGNIEVDFEAIVFDGWYFSELANKHTPYTPGRDQGGPPVLSSSHRLYSDC